MEIVLIFIIPRIGRKNYPNQTRSRIISTISNTGTDFPIYMFFLPSSFSNQYDSHSTIPKIVIPDKLSDILDL